MKDWPDHAPAQGWATQRTVHVFDADELAEALSSPDGLAIIRKMIERRGQFVPQALGTQILVDLTIEHVRQGLSGEDAVQAAEAAWRKLNTTIARLERAASSNHHVAAADSAAPDTPPPPSKASRRYRESIEDLRRRLCEVAQAGTRLVAELEQIAPDRDASPPAPEPSP